ncbi:protein-tyrosine phosphatase family protein [Ramlibacter sp. PS4R-6]|uniref:protein-tyrosine phosphatase family protein n=1 Tax=Ramlibacter sp. PS4R-6 TaxID=3133438 RepID=UPI003097095B
MNLRPVELPATVRGSLWLSAMPGRYGSMREFEDKAKAGGLKVVVCLTPRDEIDELSPDYGAAVRRGGASYEWVHLPVPNFGVPPDAKAFRAAIDRIARRIEAGESVLMHCAAGMGRTGSAAACVLKALGLPAEEALERVRAAGSNPQNAAQSGFVDWF